MLNSSSQQVPEFKVPIKLQKEQELSSSSSPARINRPDVHVILGLKNILGSSRRTIGTYYGGFALRSRRYERPDRAVNMVFHVICYIGDFSQCQNRLIDTY